MDIRAFLDKRAFRREFDALLRVMKGDPEMILGLLEFAKEKEGKAPSQLSHLIAVLSEEDFDKLEPYLEEILAFMLHYEERDAVVRNVLRIFKTGGIPKTYRGRVIDLCFKKLASYQSAVAVKVYSMMLLPRLCEGEEVLLRELKLLIEDFMPHGSAAFQSRGKKTLVEIEGMLEC